MKQPLLSSLIAMLLCSGSVDAQTACAPREGFVQQLLGKYQEAPQAMGVSNTGFLMELFASEHTGSWTIMLTRPDGQTCIIYAGQGYIEAIKEKEGELR